MKSYTDLEQSKKLAEILPFESADMMHDRLIVIPFNDGSLTPCWSLAALLNALPNNEHIQTNISRGSWKIDTVEYLPNTWWCEYEDNKNQTEFNISAENPIDACYKMLLKLHEQKLI